MSGETEQSVSGWSVDTLNSHLIDLLEERDKRYVAALMSAMGAITTRLDAIDKATDKFESNLNRVPTDVDKQVGHLKELTKETFRTVDERFAGVGLQFAERDTRSEQESKDNKVAVDAAFAAQKEAASEQNKSNTLAIDKSEKATAETLNKQADLFKSTTDALDGKHNDLKERVTRIESFGIGTVASQATQRDTSTVQHMSNSFVVSVFAVIVATGGLIGLIIEIIRAHP